MLPILIGGSILATLLKNAIDKKAKEIVKEADIRFNSKRKELEYKQKELENRLISLRNIKYSILNEDFKRYVSFTEKLKRRVKIKETFVDDIVQLLRDIEIGVIKIKESIEKVVLQGSVLETVVFIGRNGIVLSLKGEEALTEAKEYEYKVEKAIGEMEVQIRKVNCLIKKAEEKEKVLTELRRIFKEFMDIYEKVNEITEADLHSIYTLAKNIKHLIDLTLADKDKENVC